MQGTTYRQASHKLHQSCCHNWNHAHASFARVAALQGTMHKQKLHQSCCHEWNYAQAKASELLPCRVPCTSKNFTRVAAMQGTTHKQKRHQSCCHEWNYAQAKALPELLPCRVPRTSKSFTRVAALQLHQNCFVFRSDEGASQMIWTDTKGMTHC